MLYWPMHNVLYVEGYALDRFAEGLWALKPVHQNRVCYSCAYLLWTICHMLYFAKSYGVHQCLPCDMETYLYTYKSWMNQIGLVLDAGIEEELRIRHLQVADAARASLGLPVMEYVVTETPLVVSSSYSREISDLTLGYSRPLSN